MPKIVNKFKYYFILIVYNTTRITLYEYIVQYIVLYKFWKTFLKCFNFNVWFALRVITQRQYSKISA